MCVCAYCIRKWELLNPCFFYWEHDGRSRSCSWFDFLVIFLRNDDERSPDISRCIHPTELRTRNSIWKQDLSDVDFIRNKNDAKAWDFLGYLIFSEKKLYTCYFSGKNGDQQGDYRKVWYSVFREISIFWWF